MGNTDQHNWPTPDEGDSNYEDTFSDFFEELDDDVEIRGLDSDKSNYSAVDGARFFATDTEKLYIGDGSSWNHVGSTGKNPSFDSLDTDGATINQSLDILDKLVAPSKSQTPTDVENQQLWVDGTDRIRVQTSSGLAFIPLNTVLATVDDFEDNDIAEYTGDTGTYAVQSSTVYEGSYALEASGGGLITSTSGLGTYPSQGDVIGCRVRGDSDFGGIVYGVPSGSGGSSPDGYLFHADVGKSTANIQRINSGSFTKLAETTGSIPTGEFLLFELDWTTDGNHLGSIYSASGSKILDVSTQDDTHEGSGIGFRSGGAGTHQFDQFHLR